jgi:molybdate transport system regulatory protein
VDEESGAGEAIRTRALEVGPFRLRLQVVRDGEGAFGPGKAAVLEAIEASGSISAAGRSLGISYRRCWVLVDEMNRSWASALVELQRGGKAQGAKLSPLGRTVLDAYRGLERRLTEGLAASPEAEILSRHLSPRVSDVGGASIDEPGS